APSQAGSAVRPPAHTHPDTRKPARRAQTCSTAPSAMQNQRGVCRNPGDEALADPLVIGAFPSNLESETRRRILESPRLAGQTVIYTDHAAGGRRPEACDDVAPVLLT